MGPQANIHVVCLVLASCFTLISSRCSAPSTQRKNLLNIPSPIKMAIQPQCGSLSSDKFVNFNTGINLDKIENIFSFGDSWTATGNSVGGKAKPPVAVGTDPSYSGRASNGPVWIEDLAGEHKVLKSFAVGGATVDRTLWSLRSNRTDMVGHVDIFLKQNLTIQPATSLGSIFYGINDYAASNDGPGTMKQSGDHLLNQTERLINAGLKQFLVVSPHFNRDKLAEFDTTVWNGLKKLKETKGIEFTYVDLVTLFSAIHDHPSSFRYKSIESCLKSVKTTVGGCDNPDDYLFWMPGHPQRLTHRLMAEWIHTVFTKCGESNSSKKVLRSRL